MDEPEATLTPNDAATLTAAAEALYAGATLPPGTAQIVADILRAEAWFIESLPAFVSLIDLALEQASGGMATIALQRSEDGIRVVGDNTTNAIRLAQLITAKD